MRWLTSEKNPYFAKAMVNRVWAQYFGRGLVNPVDNLSDENAPSHPELFEVPHRHLSRGQDQDKQSAIKHRRRSLAIATGMSLRWRAATVSREPSSATSCCSRREALLARCREADHRTQAPRPGCSAQPHWVRYGA